jgi:hypothetical protein
MGGPVWQGLGDVEKLGSYNEAGLHMCEWCMNSPVKTYNHITQRCPLVVPAMPVMVGDRGWSSRPDGGSVFLWFSLEWRTLVERAIQMGLPFYALQDFALTVGHKLCSTAGLRGWVYAYQEVMYYASQSDGYRPVSAEDYELSARRKTELMINPLVMDFRFTRDTRWPCWMKIDCSLHVEPTSPSLPLV